MGQQRLAVEARRGYAALGLVRGFAREPEGAFTLFPAEDALARSFHSARKVEGLTHRFYRYPARFSPQIARQIISELSMPGDVVLDPFMGGGTTIVEALAAGRRAIGIDINSLAHFVTRAKITPLSTSDFRHLEDWALSLPHLPTDLHSATGLESDHRTRNLPESAKSFFAAALGSVPRLKFPRQRRFARCALLRVGQWALDNNQSSPAMEDVAAKLTHEIFAMLEGLLDLVKVARQAGFPKNKLTANATLIHSSFSEPAIQNAMQRYDKAPKLVLTSPPYPGVHVLYHRWQISGRRETPAPYWLADLQDGRGASYYTMGSRSSLGLRNYYTVLRRGFENLKRLLSPDAILVQLVAFSNKETQLPLYEETLDEAGYEKLQLPGPLSNGNHVRTVPHRKWYTNGQLGEAGQEILMFHRPRV